MSCSGNGSWHRGINRTMSANAALRDVLSCKSSFQDSDWHLDVHLSMEVATGASIAIHERVYEEYARQARQAIFVGGINSSTLHGPEYAQFRQGLRREPNSICLLGDLCGWTARCIVDSPGMVVHSLLGPSLRQLRLLRELHHSLSGNDLLLFSNWTYKAHSDLQLYVGACLGRSLPASAVVI